MSEVTVILVHTSIQSNIKTPMEKALEIKHHRNNEPGLARYWHAPARRLYEELN